jgi:glycosyltransferase involved in cell wall biosynthesis
MIVGQFLSFGIGGADKASFGLTKGLIELNVDVKIFYNKQSFPHAGMLSRFEQCRNLGVPMYEVPELVELNNHNLTVLNTHRSGDDSWFVPGFEQTDFNFKVVETNVHGFTQTKADMRVFPSEAMIKDKGITCPYVIIPNPIINKLNDDNLRIELGLENKFIFGRITRPEIYSIISLQAFKWLEDNNNDIHFLYVAPNDVVENDAKMLGIKNITFYEQTIDEVLINKIYNTFDVLCHCTPLGETFGNTVAEAMIHGKPVVSQLGEGGWPQAQLEVLGEFNHYVCGYSNAIEYSRLMNVLYKNKREYSNYANYVKEYADKNYNYLEVAKKYLEVYKHLS